jgi:hypothetical protein
MAAAETPKTSGPQINNQFWFDFAKEWVQQSVTKLEGASAKIQTMVGWLWGVYTAGASIGVALTRLSYPSYVNILIATPSVLLIAAYCLAAQVQMPTKIIADPNTPSKIQMDYANLVASKYNRLKWSLGFTFSAAIMVAVALVGASFNRQSSAPSFQAAMHTQNGRDTVAVTGHFTPDTEVVLTIASYPGTEGSNVLKELPYVTSSSGDVQTNIALDSTSQKYNVSVTWKEKDGLVQLMQRTISP